MSKAYALLCFLLILVLLTACGARIVPAVPTVTPSASPEEVPPPPTPTPLLSPPPEAVPTPGVSPTPRVSSSPAPGSGSAELPVQRHFPPRLPENWQEELPAAETIARASTYTVSAGECLWTIAERVYGSGSVWSRLWAANRETVEDPGLVWVDQVLKLPEE